MIFRFLDDRWSELKANWREAGRGDPKAVHALRVLSRRLIAALDLVRVVSGNGDIPRLRRRLRKLLPGTGEVRDMQVLRAMSKTLLPTDVKGFRRHLKEREHAAARRLHQVLDPSRRRKVLAQWDGIRADLQSRGRVSELQTRRKVQAVLKKRMDRLGLAINAVDVRDIDTLHTLRIAFKKLRYTCESASTLFGIESGKRLTAQSQEYQKQLGEIRDLEMLRKEILRWAEDKGSQETARIRQIHVSLQIEVQSGLARFKSTLLQSRNR